VFVHGKPLQPSLTFAVKVGAYRSATQWVLNRKTQRLEKIAKFFKEEPKQFPNEKRPKCQQQITTKLNLKVQNIYIKPLLKPLNTFNKPCFKLLI
jgi:hypothetical protein